MASCAFSPLLQLVQDTTCVMSSFRVLLPPSSEADPALAAEARRLHVALGAWLATPPAAASSTTIATVMTGLTADVPPVHLLDLPDPGLLLVLSFLAPFNPRRNDGTPKWADVGALAATCRRMHEVSQNDVMWRPVCDESWPPLADPVLRSVWQSLSWAALHRHSNGQAAWDLGLEEGGTEKGMRTAM